MSDNIFYSYIYLDPRKSGKFVYGDYQFDYRPFYVGKGKDYQLNTHLAEARNHTKCISKNPFKFYKIKSILEYGKDPIIIKCDKNLSEQEAFDLEIWLIWAIGRADLGLGALTNLTDGGEGNIGWSEPARSHMRLLNLGKIHSLSHRQKTANSNRGKKRSKESRERIRISKLGNKNPQFGKPRSLDVKRKISKTLEGNKNGVGNENHAKHFLVKDPNNNIFNVKNMASFCRQNNLNSECMYCVAKKVYKQHKGYTCTYKKE